VIAILTTYLKGLVLRLTKPDPCSDFLAELERNDELELEIRPRASATEAEQPRWTAPGQTLDISRGPVGESTLPGQNY